MSDAGSGGADDLFAIVARELRTIVRIPAVVTLLVVLGLTVVAVVTTGSGARGGYVSLVLGSIPFVEAFAPLLAVALRYRAVLSGRESGELDALRTFDVSRPAYIDGVHFGWGLVLVSVVFGSLLVAGVTVLALSPPDPTFLALNGAADSSVAFLRFSVFAVLSALAVAAVALAVSTTARTARQAIALAVGLFVVFITGVDAAVVAGLASGNLGIDAVPLVLAASPNGASRSLVLGVAIGTGGGGSPVAALARLVGWVVVAFAVAVLTAWRPVK